MSVGWVAGSVRARAMTRRRLGRAAVRALAGRASVADALVSLAGSPYGHDVRPGQSLEQAQRAVVEGFVWNMRVLSGWVPREGVTMLRVLLGCLEIWNTDDHLRRLAGAHPPPAYRLGALATAWPRLTRASTLDEVRQVLAASAWGDPGAADPRDIALAMRTCLADRVMAAVPAAAAWAAGATALLVAREATTDARPLPARAQIDGARVLGPAAVAAGTLGDLVPTLSGSARWALADVSDGSDLWRAEAGWWRRVEDDGFALARRATAGPEVLAGTVAVMAVDAWRVRAALETAARGGLGLEVFDAVA